MLSHSPSCSPSQLRSQTAQAIIPTVPVVIPPLLSLTASAATRIISSSMATSLHVQHAVQDHIPLQAIPRPHVLRVLRVIVRPAKTMPHAQAARQDIPFPEVNALNVKVELTLPEELLTVLHAVRL